MAAVNCLVTKILHNIFFPNYPFNFGSPNLVKQNKNIKIK